ncbi:DUF5819 family protein, partial [Streptomyces sp. NPDC004230]
MNHATGCAVRGLPAAAVTAVPCLSHLRFPVGRRLCEAPARRPAFLWGALRPTGAGPGPTLPPTSWRARLRVRGRRRRRSGPLQQNIDVQVRAEVLTADGGVRTTGWYD